ncbi:MAG: hypothetical protein ABIK93_04805 [candidate division WOR-3 bacterium]
MKKSYGRNQELLNKTLAEIIARWKKEGLEEVILLKLKDRIFSVLATLRSRGEI